MNKHAVVFAVFFIILSGCFALFFAWLFDRSFKSPAISIEQGVIKEYNYTTNNNQLNATFDITVYSKNRDTRYTLYYDNVMVVMYLNKSRLAYENLGPYKQRHGRGTTFVVVPVVRNLTISNATTAGELLEVEVRVLANVKGTIKGWHSWGYALSGVCNPVVFDLDLGRTLGKTNCIVRLFE